MVHINNEHIIITWKNYSYIKSLRSLSCELLWAFTSICSNEAVLVRNIIVWMCLWIDFYILFDVNDWHETQQFWGSNHRFYDLNDTLDDKFICCGLFEQFYESFGGTKCLCGSYGCIKLHLLIVTTVVTVNRHF